MYDKVYSCECCSDYLFLYTVSDCLTAVACNNGGLYFNLHIPCLQTVKIRVVLRPLSAGMKQPEGGWPPHYI
jgi:hypothetical protein